MTRSIKHCILLAARAALEIGNLVLLRATRGGGGRGEGEGGEYAINQQRRGKLVALQEFAPS
jgi:hypothetical protein